MSLLRKVCSCAADIVANVWGLVIDGGWAVWQEVADGSARLSWWMLVGLAWLDGLAVGWWLWNH